MILPGNSTLKTLFCFMIIFVFTKKALGFPNGEKKFDIKIGFDLTQGENGAPALKLRPFKDSEYHPRAEDDSSSVETTTKPAVRAAESISESGEDSATEKNADLKIESSKQSSEESNNDTEEEGNRFTKAGVVESEDKRGGEGVSNSESEGLRRKRSVKKNKSLRRNLKMIESKFNNARKLGVSKYG